MRNKEIEIYKTSLKLNTRQRSILVGTLLGDGHLETQNGRKTFRLKVEHMSKQQPYVDWLYREFQEWVRTPPYAKQKLLNDKVFTHFCFQTLSVAQFRFYGLQFYDMNGKKLVPKYIHKLLTPLALAVWFMDDGSSKSQYHRALIFNTHCFSRQDINILQRTLLQRYEIKTTVRNQKDGLQILITGNDSYQFMEIVKPYILPNFLYKFGPLLNKMPKE